MGRSGAAANGGILPLVTALLQYRRPLWSYPMAIAVVVTGLSFLFPNMYRSHVTVLPPERDFQSMGQSSSELKAYFSSGLALPMMATPSDILAAVLMSETARDSLAQRLSLERRWQASRAGVRTMLGGCTGVKVTPVGIIEVWAEDRNPWFADTLVNTLVAVADRINQAIVNTKAGRTRQFVEQRLDETRVALDGATTALQQFQNQHRTVALDVEIQAIVESAAKLRAQMTADQIELSVLQRTLSPEHPQIRALETRIRQTVQKLTEFESPVVSDSAPEFLGAGLTELPRLTQELAARLRDVKVAEALYELLIEQFEHARIQERRDTPTFSVLDRAVGGGSKVRPRRVILALSSLVVGFVLTTAMVLARVRLEHLAATDPARHEALLNLWRTVLPHRGLGKRKVAT
ncbi:MAG: GNVR domain-containing protein [Candidatus Zixiibacteriota bacterium]